MLQRLFLISIASLTLAIHGLSQVNIAPHTYWIEFTDKDESPYSVDRPEEFLTQRAIDRRLKQGIPVTIDDLPVNSIYIDSLKSLGVQIHNISKWFNGAAIYSTDTILINSLSTLGFIKATGKNGLVKQAPKKNNKLKNGEADIPAYSDNQLTMLNLPYLHSQGIDGEGALIGIQDAGFRDVEHIESVEHLWHQNKIIASRDFVKDGENLFANHSHGTKVFSIIGGNWTGNLIGAAPQADYILIRTENSNTEYLVEEYNWISGIEFADSLGVDVVNSSLGYTEFDDESHNHTYDDLDGRTTPITIGATIAARKGIIVVTSAGNSGNDAWYYISAPGDADSILTIGAVTEEEDITSFSSRGPTADGRIKPDVSARGNKTVSQHVPGSTSTCTGTSCSAPLITGLTACLVAAHPKASAFEVRQAIIMSSSQYETPDNDYGYGIPDAYIAHDLLSDTSGNKPDLTKISLYPNPTNGPINLLIDLPWLSKYEYGTILIYDYKGAHLYSEETMFQPGFNVFFLSETDQLQAGYYFIHTKIDGRTYAFPFIKIDAK